MERYGSYYKLLDELRIAKNVSIQDLCDGIISERTYLRQMKNGSKVNFTTFSKLLNKLDVCLAQFMTYMIHFAKEDSGVNRFTIRVHVSHFMDMEPIYQRILCFKSGNKIEILTVKSFIIVYEFKINKLVRETFKTTYQIILDELKVLNADNILSSLIKFIYHTYFKEDTIIDIRSFGQMLLDYNSTLSLFYFIMLMDVYLSFVAQQKNIDLEMYTKILDKFQFYFQYINIKNYECSLETYKAYVYHIKKEYALRDKYLYKAFMNSVIIHSPYARALYNELVKKGFGIEVKTFLIEQSEKLDDFIL